MHNWKFWFKIMIASISLISIFCFIIGYGIDVLSDIPKFWNNFFISRGDNFTDTFKEKVLAMSLGQGMIFILCRNVFVLTTLSNLLMVVFMLISAFNKKGEGKGGFDNYKWGYTIAALLIWVFLFYNISMIVSHNFAQMRWYNYVSWVCEHSLITLLAIIYLLFFYHKTSIYHNFKKERIIVLLHLFIPIFAYQIIFMIFGTVLKATNALPIFGDMSSTGYFPYDFLDLTSTNKFNRLNGINPILAISILNLVFLIEHSIIGFCYQRTVKKLYLQPNFNDKSFSYH